MVDHEGTRDVVATPLRGVSTTRTRLLKRRTVPWLQRTGTSSLSKQRAHSRGFTLAELLVSVGVLVVVVFLAMQLFNSAATVATLGHKRMDEDAQTRQLFDRMAIDFAQMVKRSDIDYYVKSSWFATGAPPGPAGVRTLLQPGNDQIAFYCSVPGYGYFPTPTYESPLSVVAYRINQNPAAGNPAYLRLERMGKGLLWNAAPTPIVPTPTPTASPTPVLAIFMPVPLASPLPTPEMPVPAPSPAPSPACAWAGSSTSSWGSDSEIIGPQVFRFEYYYLLRGQTDPLNTTTTYPAILSDTPWDTRICSCPSPTPSPTPTGTPIATPTPPSLCCHVAPQGMQDVAAVVVVIAVIDPKSRALIDNSAQVPPPNDNITLLGAQLIDWGSATCPGCGTLPCPTQQQWQTTPGLLQAQWQCALNNIIANGGRIGNTSTILPLAALSGIRFYERTLYLSPPTLFTP